MMDRIESFVPDHSGEVTVRFTPPDGDDPWEVDIIGWAVTMTGKIRPVIIDDNGMPTTPDSAEDRAAGIGWRLLTA